jgi:hypothetical protein
MLTYLADSDSFEFWNGTAYTGLGGAATNAIINGAFDNWQRGTSVTTSAASSYLADRFVFNNTGSPGTVTLSRQNFTPGEAPFAPEESAFFSRINITAAFTASNYEQRIEDVRTFAGKTVTLSFYAKADSAQTITPRLQQNFGSGGSTSVSYTLTDISLTTSWQRFTRTVALDSLTGKTIGSASFLGVQPFQTVALTGTFDIWGVQLEAGSTATPFKRNANSLQGELAACQRYYVRIANPAVFADVMTSGFVSSTTAGEGWTTLPVPLRVSPTSIDFSTISAVDTSGTRYAISAATLNSVSSNTIGHINFTSSGMTAGRYCWIQNNNSAAGFLGFSAEL